MEEEQTKLLEREDPHRDSDDWGFERRPSRACPVNDVFIEWIYLIDLDLNVFRVSDSDNNDPLNPGAEGTRDFRLDNIPRHLFTGEAEDGTDLGYYTPMSEWIPAEYLATDLDSVPETDPALLEFFESFTPPPEATFSLPSGDRTSAWHRVQLELICEFVDYYVCSFRDSCPSRNSSPFVFQQMAYAILGLTSRAGIKFHHCTSIHLLDPDEPDPQFRIPSWEPPDSDTYWLGDFFIVLDQHVSVASSSANTKASIARAVQLAPATPTTAVILSVNAVILVHIVPGEQITHTVPLPLLNMNPDEPSFTPEALASLKSVSYSTPGVLALLDLFNTHPRIAYFAPLSPARLPAELCRMVFRATDEATQNALESSCRLFRVVAGEYPRIGERTFVKWGLNDFLQLGTFNDYGWQVGLWGREKFELNMPVVWIGGSGLSLSLEELECL